MDTLTRLDDIHHTLVTQIENLVSVACVEFHYKDGAFSERITQNIDALRALSMLFDSDIISPAEEAAFRYAYSVVNRIYEWSPTVENGQFFRLIMERFLVLQSLTMVFAGTAPV